jgi:hypothetical protein
VTQGGLGDVNGTRGRPDRASAALVALAADEVRTHPGISPAALRERLEHLAADAVDAAVASGSVHERPTPWRNAVGQSRLRPGLYPGDGSSRPAVSRLGAPELRAARRRAGLRQRELADALAVSQGMVSLWETGRRLVPPGRVDHVLAVLDRRDAPRAA